MISRSIFDENGIVFVDEKTVSLLMDKNETG